MTTQSRPRLFAWTLLCGLLAMTLVGALVYSRAGWTAQLSGEATYLMQAESLARDGDLRYERHDYDRLLLAAHANPTDLELASGSDGKRIGFARPFPYALYLAPFVRLDPAHGFALANALLLALTACFAARTLERRIGDAAPALVMLAIFASATFAHVFLVTGDLFLLCLVVVAFCLLDAAAAPDHGSPRAALVAGALLAVAVLTEPLHLFLLGGAVFTVAGTRRAALLLGAFLSAMAQIVVQWWATGGLLVVATERFRFTPETGFPLVDFPVAEWSASLRHLSALHWEEAARWTWGLDPRLWAWDTVDLLFGRHVGLLPYFAPLLLFAALARWDGPRRALAVAALLWCAALVVVHPFNLYGGEGTIANRLVLPVYGMLWMLAARRRARRVEIAVAVAVLALAAPFLWRLWSSPWTHPVAPGRAGHAYTTPLAERLLPYETAQRRIPSGQLADHGALRVHFLDERGWAEPMRDRLRFDGTETALLVLSAEPLDVLRVEFGEDGPSTLEVDGGEIGETILTPAGGVDFRLLLPGAARSHAQWWSPERWWIYPLRLRLPETAEPNRATAFRLVGERVADDDSPGDS